MSRKADFAKLDELYDDNRKVKRAWRRNRATVGLHAQAITYCKRHQTDGIVDAEWIEDKLPAAKEREKVLRDLLDIGLFEAVKPDSYRVHDFLDWQLSKAERERISEQATSAANARWDATRNADRMRPASDPQCETDANGNAGRNAEKEEEKEEEETALSGKPDVARIEDAQRRVRRQREQQVFDAWVEACGKTDRVVFDDKRRRVIRRALEHFPLEDVVDAVKGWKRDPFYRGENDRHRAFNDLGLLLRDSEHIERFRDLERGTGKPGSDDDDFLRAG